jgi:acetyl esterase/lipase
MRATSLKLIPAIFLIFAFTLVAGAAEAPHHEILLWPEGAPGAVGNEAADRPSLFPYVLPASATPRSAVVVCPGGGYVNLAMSYEGRDVAAWLNALGVDGFVLKYRLGPRYHYPAMLLDAQRALRYVRSHARDFGIAPDRIGIWGFSAGGHLAAMAGTHFDAGNPAAADPIDRASSRPDFLILAYPVITCTEPFMHVGSCSQLLAGRFDPKLAELVSNEKQVTPQTPPTFLFHTDDDDGVSPLNSVCFYLALKKAGVPAEMHIYAHGHHGVGLAPKDSVLSTWPGRLRDWLKIRGLLPAGPSATRESQAPNSP